MFKAKSGPQRYFDGWANAYDRDLARYDYSVPQAVFEALEPRLSGRPVQRLLDIGIGTGLASALFKLNFPGLHVTGIDVAQNMLDACRAKGVADRLFRCDVRRDTLPPGPYEGIIAAGILEFIERADDIIAPIARHLRPGGYAALAFETPATAPLYGGRLFSGPIAHSGTSIAIRRIHTKFPVPHVYTKYLHAPAHIARLARDSQLEVVETTTFRAYRRGNGDIVTHDLMILRK
jgi:predicted TPR repeat methyltransferase